MTFLSIGCRLLSIQVAQSNRQAAVGVGNTGDASVGQRHAPVERPAVASILRVGIGPFRCFEVLVSRVCSWPLISVALGDPG